MRGALLVGLLGLVACADKAEPCVGAGCEGADSGDTDTQDSPGTDSTETGETAESGGESGESGDSGETAETAETGEPWDPDKPLELCINEFMPSNTNALIDEDLGTYEDWIERHNPGTEDINLQGWSLTDDADDHEKSIIPDELVLEAGGFVVLYADGSEAPSGAHLGFKLGQDGGTVGVFAPDGRGSLITYGYIETDISAARVTDCCSGSDCWEYVYQGTPGTTNYVPEPVEVELVGAGSDWAYWDQGYEPDGDWTALSFDDSAWPTAPGPLGYGDDHIATAISYGDDSSNKYSTAYFRLVFSVVDAPTYTEALGAIMRDDGAVIYLNGVEVERSNMPDGDIAYDTLASSSATDETGYGAFDIDPSMLVEGDNVLAVEVHQHSADSSDLGFDMTLSAEYLPAE